MATATEPTSEGDWKLWGSEPPHPGGQAQIWARRRELWTPGLPDILFAACGPRWGKDRLCTWIMLEGLIRLLAKRRREGSQLIPLVHAWVVAPTSEDFKQVWREYKVHSQGLQHFRRDAEGSQAIFIEADPRDPERTGITIEFRSGWDPDRLVGVGLDVVHVTEAAKLPQESWEALDDRLASPGRLGKLVANGTPTEHPGRRYRELYRAGRDGDPRIIFANHATWENPHLGNEELRKLMEIKRQSSERRWQANQGAKLLPEGSGLFRGLEGVSTAKPNSFQEHVHYIKGLDLAQLGDDWNSFSVFHFENRILVQDHIERWNKVLWPRSKQRIVALVSQYPGELHIDATGQNSSFEEIKAAVSRRELVQDVTFTNLAKRNWVDHAIALVESNRVRLLAKTASDDARIQFEELTEYQEKVTGAGNVRYEHPEGGHDDTVDAFLLAAWGARDAIDIATARGMMQATMKRGLM